jgi:dipeptidyl aminopeptidase/acylaminoacyl peptidase
MPGKDIHLGGLLTEAPDSYVRQSALFHASNVTTPLLLRHGKADGAVPFYQSLQYFRLLRRLGKKVWMLQYDSDIHGVLPGKNLNDMNIRISQFYDYYLKDAPPPRWMFEGISVEEKQVATKLELDETGAKP